MGLIKKIKENSGAALVVLGIGASVVCGEINNRYFDNVTQLLKDARKLGSERHVPQNEIDAFKARYDSFSNMNSMSKTGVYFGLGVAVPGVLLGAYQIFGRKEE